MTHSPCPISAEACVAKDRYGACFADTHHLFFNRGLYRTAIEKAFRELPENKVQICRAEHDEIHATQEQPVKPTRDLMLQAIANAALQGAPNEPTEMEQRLAVVSAECAPEALGDHLAGEYPRELAS